MATLVLIGMVYCHGHAEGAGRLSFGTVGTQTPVAHDAAVVHDHHADPAAEGGAWDSHEIPNAPVIPRDHDEPFCGPSGTGLPAVQVEPGRCSEPAAVPTTAAPPPYVGDVSRRAVADAAAACPLVGTELLVMVCVSRR